MTLTAPVPTSQPEAPKQPGWRRRRQSSLTAHGEPMIWLTGGSLAVCLLMIFGLLGLVVYQGGRTFWPREIVRIERKDGGVLFGQVTNSSTYVPEGLALESMSEDSANVLRAAMGDAEDPSPIGRRQLRTENFDLTGTHYNWVDEPLIASEERPEWAMIVERLEKGRFYGEPVAFLVDDEVTAEGPDAAWQQFQDRHGEVRERFERYKTLEDKDLGRAYDKIEDARLELRGVEMRKGSSSAEYREEKAAYDATVAAAEAEAAVVQEKIDGLKAQNEVYALRMRTGDGMELDLALEQIVRAVPTNQLGFGDKVAVYKDRWLEFLLDDPRSANSEGGVWPAIFGTVIMTLIMSIMVVPLGVLAALYLREYAKQGILVSIVRIAVNNLAGVPSIVFGVFGLGFFCYIFGTSIDQLLFSERLPNPTYGKGGILWASLTLALLTLPVVIVATEEALAAVPNSMREGSYACGATKWQTIRRIVLPRAQPGIMTGAILAIARGAGEVAPLMLVGAVKLAPDLPIELSKFPYVFPERSFMHLGFHIFDVGFQSQNSEAAKPMVYTTTLLLIGIVVTLNMMAILIRARLRRRIQAAR
ncbi:MAG: phosphate ABC transporter permease PstA [Planctomycetota bacterium]|nr:phosphate ABC transporter permease PstA [Planctomycetota bacterium]